MSMADWPISRKLIASFGVVILTFGAVAAFVLSNLGDIGSASAQRDASGAALARLNEASKSVLDLGAEVRGFLLTGDEDFARAAEADNQTFLKAVDGLRGDMRSPSQKKSLEEMAAGVAGYMTEGAEPEMRLMRGPGGFEQALAIVKSGVNKKYMAIVKSAAQRIEDEEEARQVELQAQRNAAVHGSRTALLGGAGVAVAASLLMGWLLSRQIAAPIALLTAAMKRLASGDVAASVPSAHRRDEIGAMAGAVQVFKDAAIEKNEVERRADADRAAAERQRAAAESERQEIAARLGVVVDGLAGALGRLSAGDLTCALTEPFAPEYERLRNDFNAAIDELRRAIGAVVVSMSGISSGTGEISLAADDLARRTEQQAANLEQTAAAVAEITGTMRKTAEGADAARGVVAAAKDDAERGEVVVRDAVAAMSSIEQSAKEIGQIIGVIDEIAFQTNLLALNAGVEAARAGDSGRGFAVVASEVRVLAQRSADAAKEIKTLIGASTSHVARGVGLVRETGAALGRIVAQVAQINKVVGGIAASAREQASGLSQVNDAVSQMDQVTQQNAAMVEQSTAASRSLAQDAAELSKLAARFKTGTEQHAPAPRPREPAAERPAPAKSLRVVAGTSARAPADAQAWAEF